MELDELDRRLEDEETKSIVIAEFGNVVLLLVYAPCGGLIQ